MTSVPVFCLTKGEPTRHKELGLPEIGVSAFVVNQDQYQVPHGKNNEESTIRVKIFFTFPSTQYIIR